METQLNFTVEITDECYLAITPDFTWFGEEDRGDYFFIVSYETTTSINIDITNPLDLTWAILMTEGGALNVYIQAIPIFDDKQTFPFLENQLTFYDGNIYSLIDASFIPANHPFEFPDTSSSWANMDPEDMYIYNATNSNIGQYENDTIINCVMIPDISYTVTKKDCHYFEYDADYSGELVVSYYNITDFTSVSEIENEYSLLTPIDSFNYIPDEEIAYINLENDGVYVVVFTDLVTNQSVGYNILIDFCKFNECRALLATKILCNQYDPCCENCSDEFKKKQKTYSEHLNIMNALYMELDYQLNIIYKSCVLDDVPISEIDYIAIGKLAKKINKMTLRCGECNVVETKVTKPCKSC